MLTHSHRILIGANGWLHPQWQTGFYPDDLPADWQLGYYSNEFPIVLMPAAYWQSVSADIEEWLEDSHDELQLLCEVDQAFLQLPESEALSAISNFIDGLPSLGDHCIGLLLPVTEQTTDLRTIISELNSPFPLCVEIKPDVSKEKIKSIQKMCKQLEVGICWQAQGDASVLTYGQLAVTKLDTQGMNMRQLREIVETILKTTTLEQTSILIIDGNPPDLEAVRHTNVILELF